MRSVAILDSTLREGVQLTSAFFNPEQRLEIARTLRASGLPMQQDAPGFSFHQQSISA